MEDELLTLKQAAARAGVRPVTLRAAIADRKLKARKIGRDWVVTKQAIDDWTANAKHKPGPPPKA